MTSVCETWENSCGLGSALPLRSKLPIIARCLWQYWDSWSVWLVDGHGPSERADTRTLQTFPTPLETFILKSKCKNSRFAPQKTMMIVTTGSTQSCERDPWSTSEHKWYTCLFLYWIHLPLVASSIELVRIISFARSFILVWPAPNIQRWWKHIRQHASEDKQLPLKAKHPISVRVMCVIIQPPSSPSSPPPPVSRATGVAQVTLWTITVDVSRLFELFVTEDLCNLENRDLSQLRVGGFN